MKTYGSCEPVTVTAARKLPPAVQARYSVFEPVFRLLHACKHPSSRERGHPRPASRGDTTDPVGLRNIPSIPVEVVRVALTLKSRHKISMQTHVCTPKQQQNNPKSDIPSSLLFVFRDTVMPTRTPTKTWIRPAIHRPLLNSKL